MNQYEREYELKKVELTQIYDMIRTGDFICISYNALEPVSYTHLDVYKRQKEDKAYSQYALSWLKPGTALQMAGYTTGLDDRRRKCGRCNFKG